MRDGGASKRRTDDEGGGGDACVIYTLVCRPYALQQKNVENLPRNGGVGLWELIIEDSRGATATGEDGQIRFRLFSGNMVGPDVSLRYPMCESMDKAVWPKGPALNNEYFVVYSNLRFVILLFSTTMRGGAPLAWLSHDAGRCFSIPIVRPVP